jgi:hypothetical protein
MLAMPKLIVLELDRPPGGGVRDKMRDQARQRARKAAVNSRFLPISRI